MQIPVLLRTYISSLTEQYNSETKEKQKFAWGGRGLVDKHAGQLHPWAVYKSIKITQTSISYATTHLCSLFVP